MLCCPDWFFLAAAAFPAVHFLKKNMQNSNAMTPCWVCFGTKTRTTIAELCVMYMFEEDFEVVRVVGF